MPRKKKTARNLKTFVKNGRRYRVVYTSPHKDRAQGATRMYDNQATAVHFDSVKSTWLVGVRPKDKR